jgi:hypothetical protein
VQNIIHFLIVLILIHIQLLYQVSGSKIRVYYRDIIKKNKMVLLSYVI